MRLRAVSTRVWDSETDLVTVFVSGQLPPLELLGRSGCQGTDFYAKKELSSSEGCPGTRRASWMRVSSLSLEACKQTQAGRLLREARPQAVSVLSIPAGTPCPTQTCAVVSEPMNITSLG